MIITIDGPVGTGKSTIAKLLAERLGFIHFDTGAMYRCLTFGLLKHKINPDHKDQLESFLKKFNFDVQILEGQKKYYYENEDVTQEIRKERISTLSSSYSAIPEVRNALVEIQRKLGHKSNGVFEGRDMGTVVFPEADLKVFLTGTPEIRAQRRLAELKQKFPQEKHTFQEVLSQLQERDHRDTTRETSPLKPAKDSLIIDTTNLSIEGVLEAIIKELKI